MGGTESSQAYPSQPELGRTVLGLELRREVRWVEMEPCDLVF